MKKKFQTCYNCDFRYACITGSGRLVGLDINCPTINDIGCFNFEVYRRQTDEKQLKLF